MTAGPSAPAAPRVSRSVTLDAGPGVTLSALLREPAGAPPRATLVALHGTGMSAGYFDGTVHSDLSLMSLGAELGFTVLSVDRPGYGGSRGQLPDGQGLVEQAHTVALALRDFADRFDTGAGIALVAHSFGGKVALSLAASAATDPGTFGRTRLLGLDICGLGHRYAVSEEELANALVRRHWRRDWGVLTLYPPDTFRSTGALVSPTPSRERHSASLWPDLFLTLAARIQVPVRFTFAEHESWWRHDGETVADLVASLTGSPRVLVDRLPGAGHNVSLGWAARSYHLRALAFAEECLPRPH